MDCCVRGPPCNTMVVTVLVGCLASASALAIVLEMCLRLERFSPLLPPQGKGRSELMGAYNERLRTTDRLGATCYPPLPPSPLELLSGYAGERLRAVVSCVCLYCGTCSGLEKPHGTCKNLIGLCCLCSWVSSAYTPLLMGVYHFLYIFKTM